MSDELDLDELIIALEHSVTEMDNIDTESLQYQAAQKLKKLKEGFDVGFDLAGVASYAEIVGGISVNKQGIRNLCDRVFELNNKLNP